MVGIIGVAAGPEFTDCFAEGWCLVGRSFAHDHLKEEKRLYGTELADSEDVRPSPFW